MDSVFSNVKEAMEAIVCTVANQVLTIEMAWPKLMQVYGDAKRTHRRLFFVGNGGSAAIAIHMTCDFLKNGGICTQSFYDPSVMTCLANDFGYEYVFSKQVEMAATAGDVLTAISSSGNSPNILNAVYAGRACHCAIVTLTGFAKDNSLRKLGDVNIYAPSMEYGVVETIHAMVLQQVVDDIVKRDGVGMK